MEIRKLEPDSLPIPEILTLLEIARGLSSAQPRWELLKRELEQYDAWAFYERGMLLGYGLVNCFSSYFGGSVQVVELKYRWEYNQESTVTGMLCQIARIYRDKSDRMVIDIDIRRDLNRDLYQKLGFIPSVIPSLKDRNHKVLFTQLDSLLKNGFNA